MSNYPPVTGLNNIIERSKAFIAYLLHLQAENDIIASAPVALLPAPRIATTAATWDRERHVCLICQEEMTRSLFNKNEYFCLPCDQAVADEAKMKLQQLQTGRINAIKLPPGEIAKRVRAATPPGTYARDMRHARQEAHVRGVFADLSTVKELPKLPAALMATMNQPPTTPQPARNEQAPTPAPATPIPETREHLFADIPSTAYSEEEEDETTEKRVVVRKVVRKTTETIQIPAMDVEALLLDMAYGRTHTQSTGENEKLPEKIWML